MDCNLNPNFQNQNPTKQIFELLKITQNWKCETQTWLNPTEPNWTWSNMTKPDQTQPNLT